MVLDDARLGVVLNVVVDSVEKSSVPSDTSAVPRAGLAVRGDVFCHEPTGAARHQGPTRKDTPFVYKRVQFTLVGKHSGATIKVVYISFPTKRLVHESAYPTGGIIKVVTLATQ